MKKASKKNIFLFIKEIYRKLIYYKMKITYKLVCNKVILKSLGLQISEKKVKDKNIEDLKRIN